MHRPLLCPHPQQPHRGWIQEEGKLHSIRWMKQQHLPSDRGDRRDRRGREGEREEPLPLRLPATTGEGGAGRETFPANSVATLTEPGRPEKEKLTLLATDIDLLAELPGAEVL